MKKQDQCCSNCRYVYEESDEGYYLVCMGKRKRSVVKQGDYCNGWAGDEKEVV